MTSAPEPLILAIDDDPTQIDVLAQLLAGTARVVGCTDPVEALHGKISGLEQSILTDWPNGQTDEQALRTKLISIAEDVAALPPPA